MAWSTASSAMSLKSSWCPYSPTKEASYKWLNLKDIVVLVVHTNKSSQLHSSRIPFWWPSYEWTVYSHERNIHKERRGFVVIFNDLDCLL